MWLLRHVSGSLIGIHTLYSIHLLYSIKSGKVVVVLNGKYAGKKAVVVKAFENGQGSRKFSHCIGKNAHIVAFMVGGYIFHTLCQ